MIKFPKNFQFGAAISSMQTEGRGTTEIGKLTFDKLYEIQPEKFYNGVGPELTSDIMNHYKEDLAMLGEIKLEGLRTGFSWARLFPDGKTLNQEAVDFYHDYIKEMKKNNIQVFMTFFHFDMPMWAQELGAWSSNEVIDSFVEYTKFCFEEYKDEVDYYVTFNEPLNPVLNGYTGSAHYPCINDPKQAVQQAYGIYLAHAKVTKVFYEQNLQHAKIGMVFDWNYSYAVDDKPETILAEKIFDAYVNRGAFNIFYNGTISKLLIDTLEQYGMTPRYTEEELTILSETKVDFMGINYYFPSRIRARENKDAVWALDTVDRFIPEGARMNPFRGWEIDPKGLYDIAIAVRDEYDNVPWYIAENGMGVENEDQYRDESGMIQDDYRIDFVGEHLEWLKKGLDEGSACFGYHMWTAIDCWSFMNAYKNRYGLIEVNLDDQTRKFKKSAFWYKDLIENKE
ncbi:glycoside hydrolase family 1 protein [[Acholeplasma] multilocale]|uniref:glycoside hydrolase family 1 protein n=1 Tax=[Acholeplasma] multilocale TaxID=264638 RepID=UPI00047DEB62|nr:glycoside hydrolase family 1 protein [[Acholeplasma] multilocale]